MLDACFTCTPPSDGSEVGPKLNGNVCGAATLGTSFSSTHSWPCMAQPFFNDMDLIECFLQRPNLYLYSRDSVFMRGTNN